MLEYLDPEYSELVKLCWVFVPQGVCFIEYCAFWTCFGIVKVYVFWFEYLGLNGTYLLYRNKSKFLLHLLRFNFFIKNKLGGKNKLVYFLFVFEIKLFEILNIKYLLNTRSMYDRYNEIWARSVYFRLPF